MTRLASIRIKDEQPAHLVDRGDGQGGGGGRGRGGREGAGRNDSVGWGTVHASYLTRAMAGRT